MYFIIFVIYFTLKMNYYWVRAGRGFNIMNDRSYVMGPSFYPKNKIPKKSSHIRDVMRIYTDMLNNSFHF